MSSADIPATAQNCARALSPVPGTLAAEPPAIGQPKFKREARSDKLDHHFLANIYFYYNYMSKNARRAETLTG